MVVSPVQKFVAFFWQFLEEGNGKIIGGREVCCCSVLVAIMC